MKTARETVGTVCCRLAQPTDLPVLAGLGAKLWPHHTAQQLQQEFAQEMQAGAQFFLAQSADVAIGFAQCTLRHDYVEGTSSSPVGYLEGLYVDAAFRRSGVAAALLAAAEEWARQQGCREFASDCALENTLSQMFHQKLGFTEAARVVCYTKSL